MNAQIKNKVQDFLNDRIVNSDSVSGGCIADSKLITTESGAKYFLKTKAQFPDMFLKEANGLKELAKSNCIRVPKVFLADSDFLLLEYIEKGRQNSDFFDQFGHAFAQMHKYSSKTFGFYEDNYIGASPQYNIANNNEQNNWADFYYNRRILEQYKMLENKGLSDSNLRKGVIKLEKIVQSLLKGTEEAPSLMHGDLWSGNFMCDTSSNPVIFDPAVYYGHRELDLAMTKMFGGFRYEFYTSYHSEFPLVGGWQEREKIYLLYHYLNHLNLFGSSYYSSVINIINYYI